MSEQTDNTQKRRRIWFSHYQRHGAHFIHLGGLMIRLKVGKWGMYWAGRKGGFHRGSFALPFCVVGWIVRG